MSIESLATGDTVIKQTVTDSAGASWGPSAAVTDGASYDCLVQNPTAREATDFAARGINVTHIVYFSQDVALTSKHRLKQTVKAGETLDTPLILRVRSYRKEGRPGEDLLWIAACDTQDTRHDV